MFLPTLSVGQTLMTNVASEVTARLSSAESSAFSRQHLANLIWSFATLEVLDPPLSSYNITPVSSTDMLECKLLIACNGQPSNC